MREMDRQDDQPALGKPIRTPVMPEPHRKVTDDGTVRQTPDGKFYTKDPKNDVANWALSIMGINRK